MLGEDYKEKTSKIIERFYNKNSESLNLCTFQYHLDGFTDFWKHVLDERDWTHLKFINLGI